MKPIIATRADLETLRGTPAYDEFIAFLRGTLTTRSNIQVYPDGYDTRLQEGDLGYLPPIYEDRPSPDLAAGYGFTPTQLDPSWNPSPVTSDTYPVPEYDPATQRVRFASGSWVIEATPSPSDAVIYTGKQSEGYLDTATGIRLKATDAAQLSFTKFVALSMLAMQAGAITTATVQSIWDFEGAEHALPTGQLLALMLRYGLYCSTMFSTFAP